MFPVLQTELIKLQRSLALLLVVAAPTLVALFLLLLGLRDGQQQPWEAWRQSASAIWAFFMLPMSVTALTALMAQTEHAPRAWDQLRALPIARWRIYGAKAFVVLAVILIMSALCLGLTVAAGHLVALIRPENAPTGPMGLVQASLTMGRIFAAAILMVAIQFFLAIRFSSFVPGLVLGIAGTFFATVATGAKQGVFLPWQMPVNVLSTEGWRVNTALGLGLGGGLLVLALAIAWLSRRDVL